MPSARSLITVVCTVAACGLADRAPDDDRAATPASALDVAAVGFATPEAMLHDATADVYLVSNISGVPVAKDDNGFISRLAPSGELVALRWIDGASTEVTLHAPKGMALRGDTLFVADIDAVRLFDRTTGAPVGEWPLEGAAFLNDLAVGPDGTLYVTDTGVEAGEGGLVPNGRDGVYRREGERWTAVVTGAGLGTPNGILADSAGLTIVTFGTGEIYRLDPVTGDRTMLPKPAAGGLDGVARAADGSLLVASWGAHAVYRLAGDGTFSLATDSVDAPADIAYDATRSTLLIPDFTADRVLFRPVR